MKITRWFVAVALVAATTLASAANPVVELKTSAGIIAIELYPEKAPKSVDNFLRYVKDGFYKGTIFHRVIPGFMAQGGGFTANMQQKPVREAVSNEADNGLKNTVGTVAMARTNDPHSATAQFFINVSDNDFLNHTNKTARGWGYAVFGKVVRGLDVVQRMVQVPTGSTGPFENVPLEPIVIEDARVLPNP
ncbi:MAG: peptidyl-prolyl cis-trans isomerase [Burkholderiales bacterium]|nr:peptidyl-prolyl cis-trans isomerase [Burkholderiales bacterium]